MLQDLRTFKLVGLMLQATCYIGGKPPLLLTRLHRVAYKDAISCLVGRKLVVIKCKSRFPNGFITNVQYGEGAPYRNGSVQVMRGILFLSKLLYNPPEITAIMLIPSDE